MTKEYVNLYDAHGRSLGATDEWQRVPDAYDYIIYTEGSLVKAKNGQTGEVEFKGTNTKTVVQNVINSLDSGLIVIKDIDMPSGLTFKDNVTIIHEKNGIVTVYSQPNTKLQFKETDESGTRGQFRFVVGGGSFRLDKATSEDWSSFQVIFKYDLDASSVQGYTFYTKFLQDVEVGILRIRDGDFIGLNMGQTGTYGSFGIKMWGNGSDPLFLINRDANSIKFKDYDNDKVFAQFINEGVFVTDRLRLTPMSTPPANPVTGDIYLDDGTNTADGNPHLRFWDGSAWKDL